VSSGATVFGCPRAEKEVEMEGMELIKFEEKITGPLNERIDDLDRQVRELRAELRTLSAKIQAR
jgi:hypothetical protein